MERRLTLRETEPTLGGAPRCWRQNWKSDIFPVSSLCFFFFLVPQNFVLVKWQADGVTTKWVQQNIVIHDEKKTVVDNDGKMVGWWASLHLLHPSQREYQHKFSKTILMDHGCACQKLEYHCSATILPKKAVGSNYIWSQLPIEDYGVFSASPRRDKAQGNWTNHRHALEMLSGIFALQLLRKLD